MNMSIRPTLNVKGWERLRFGHPWLYRTNLMGKDWPEVPGVINFREGAFFYSPQSEIRLRRMSLGIDPSESKTPGSAFIDDPSILTQSMGETFRKHFAALARRKRALLGGETCFRWVFAESDGVPGLVVDLLDGEIVAQVQTAPLEVLWPAFRLALEQAYVDVFAKEPVAFHELRNMAVRRKEGLKVIEVDRTVGDEGSRWVPWNGFDWWMRAGGSQKTGAYLDQKENHLAAARWAKALGLDHAWDLCSFEGGFALHLLKAGLSVTAVDQSATAIDTLQRNAERNGLGAKKLETVEANVFDWLRDQDRNNAKVPMVVLDPPSFVRSRDDRESALRGLKELNLRSLKVLNRGGLLVTCTCSHHVGPAELEDVLRAAAHDAHREVRILEERGPAPDHAPLLEFPEGRYLQAHYLEVI